LACSESRQNALIRRDDSPDGEWEAGKARALPGERKWQRVPRIEADETGRKPGSVVERVIERAAEAGRQEAKR
jgi:hypothetical protein